MKSLTWNPIDHAVDRVAKVLLGSQHAGEENEQNNRNL